MNDIFGEVIYSYTRAQAIEDGVLIDITKTAKERGLKLPTAVTSAVWSYMIDNEKVSNPEQIDVKTRDVVSLLKLAITSSKEDNNTIEYPITRRSEGKYEEVELKCVIGPGDNLEPVLTIMMPDED